MSTKKRPIDSFFKPSTQPPKKARVSAPPSSASDVRLAESQPESKPDTASTDEPRGVSNHATYPFPIPWFPSTIAEGLNYCPAEDACTINNKPHLDLLCYNPFLDRALAKDIFTFLRRELFFYRVNYAIKKPWGETQINTPRYTTVFGVDETSHFVSPDELSQAHEELLDASTNKPVPDSAYKHKPRPIPACLGQLLNITEAVTGCKFNFCLVNYYADGKDSISYHSDDERFLGVEPNIASFSLGAERDFCLRHKPPVEAANGKTSKSSGYGNKGRPETEAGDFAAVKEAADNPMKFSMGSGDMILMRGQTQSKWLHAIPKRSAKNVKGSSGEQGRINITFRRAMVKGGTENYYTYNVGEGKVVYKWNEQSKEMQVWGAL